MVDYSELKKKFKAKNPNFGEKRRKKNLAIKKIAREYELKKAEITGGPPLFTKGPAFYVLAILLLVVIGSVIVPGILNGNLTMGKKRIERNQLLARKAMTSLSIALGRYRFHVGEYPTDKEGLQVLSFRKPDEIRRIRKIHPGWDGPYVNHIVKDPWGHDYFYARRPAGGTPILYSCGPDGRAGSTDDILPDRLDFDAAFRDTSWTNHWAPCELRGVVVAPDEATKRRVQNDMKAYD